MKTMQYKNHEIKNIRGLGIYNVVDADGNILGPFETIKKAKQVIDTEFLFGDYKPENQKD